MTARGLSLTTAVGLACAAVLALLPGRAVAQPPPPFPYLGDYDLNFDARMDDADLVAFFGYYKAFRKTPSVYDAIADFNKDQKIDRVDAAMIIAEWLKFYPYYHTASASAAPVGTAAATAAATASRKASAAKAAVRPQAPPPAPAG